MPSRLPRLGFWHLPVPLHAGRLNLRHQCRESVTFQYSVSLGYWEEVGRNTIGVRTIAKTLASGPPSNPQNGDIWIATAVDANGTVWQFRYNAGSASAYKWEFIGGGPLSAAVATAEAIPAGSGVVDAATVGPQVTLVRGGDYWISTYCQMNVSTPAGATPTRDACPTRRCGSRGRCRGRHECVHDPPWRGSRQRHGRCDHLEDALLQQQRQRRRHSGAQD